MSYTQIKERIEELQSVIKEVNGCIAALHKTAARLNRGAGGREVSLSITKLQEAQMWLAEALVEVRTSLPEGE